MDQAPLGYRERLLPAWWVWLILGGLVTMLAVAYGAALGSTVGWTVAAALTAIGSSFLVLTSPRLVVDHGEFRVGHARLPDWAIADVRVCDREAVRELRGSTGDARLFTVLRSWSAPGAIVVDIADPADPHPAWLVSSRHPEALRQALSATMIT